MDDIKRYIDLKYLILKYKHIYYNTPKDYQGNYIKGIPDQEYDILEDEYKKLREHLTLLLSHDIDVTQIVGFDMSIRECRSTVIRVFIENMPDSIYEKYRKQILDGCGYNIDVHRESNFQFKE